MEMKQDRKKQRQKVKGGREKEKRKAKGTKCFGEK
jgi:hypothetical protein